ncbi:MAG: TonB-dependent receptor [Acidobacteriota bacterium]|nr:TonB-dependent receptor [Acidobacteriota bacterium]
MPARNGGCSTLIAGLGGVYNAAKDKCIMPVNPLAQPFLNLYGPPNRPSEDGGLTADQASNSTQPTNEDYFNARVDHNFSDSDSFFGRYTTSVGSKDQALDGGSHQPSALTTTRNDNHYSTMEWKHIFSPNTINTFRFGAQRNTWYQDPSNDGGIYIGFYPDRAMGVIGVGDGVARQGINVNGQNVSNQFSYANDMFLTRGRHDIKLGILASRHQTNDFTLGRGGGEFTFDSVPEFVAGVPYRWRGRNQDDIPQRGVRQTVLGFYIQDDFKMTPNLTVNMGMRYEPTVRLSEVNGRTLNLRGDLKTVEKAIMGLPYFENPSMTNFAPRLGFAWDPFGDGKTSVRAGYGIFHITILPFHYSNQIRRSPPLSVSPDVRNSRCGGCVVAAFPRPPAEAKNPPTGSVAFQTAEYKPSQPYAQQWNFSLQREIMGGVTLTGAYVGSRGTHLQAQRNPNTRIPEMVNGKPLFRGGPRYNTNFGDIDHWEFSTNSFYHGFNGGLKKRFADGLQFQVAYTFGRSIDSASRVNFSDIQENLGKFPQDQHNLVSSNQGLSAHQVQHNLSFNYVWEIPYDGTGAAGHLLGGWQMNGILMLSTGNPETLRLGGTGGTRDWNGDGESSSLAERPSLRSGGNHNPVRAGGRDPDKYLDLSNFVLHEPGGHGNVGRNTVIGPGINTFDFSLFKNFDLAEEVELQFRAEFFNLFNRTNFGRIDNRIVQRARTKKVDCSVHGGAAGSGCKQLVKTDSDPLGFDYRTTGGRIVQSRTTSRQIQFGLRLVF